MACYTMYIFGDIHEVIKTIDTDSIDFIYTSPPYGITQAEWDQPLDWANLFPELWRVLKPTGIIALHCSMPFTYELLKYQTPKYHYIWEKNNSTCGMLAKKQPLRRTEEVMIYYKKPGTYNPQMKGTTFYKKDNKQIGTEGQSYYGKRAKKTKIDNEIGHYGNYPDTLLTFPIRREKSGITRCNDMMDFFIKTYTNIGDTILDLTTHNSCLNDRVVALKREFIGVDIVPF